MSLPARGIHPDPGADLSLAPIGDVLLGLFLLLLAGSALAGHGAPPRPAEAAAPIAATTQLVLDLAPDGLRLNGQPVADPDLDAALSALAAGRRVRLLFIRPGRGIADAVTAATLARVRRDGIGLVAFLPAER